MFANVVMPKSKDEKNMKTETVGKNLGKKTSESGFKNTLRN
jgi:hypothetical protein